MFSSSKIFGLLAVIPASLLLVVSFFIIYMSNRMQKRNHRFIGYISAIFLSLVAFLIFSTGIYVVLTGKQSILQAVIEVLQP